MLKNWIRPSYLDVHIGVPRQSDVCAAAWGIPDAILKKKKNSGEPATIFNLHPVNLM
jgi:hypothetical protein